MKRREVIAGAAGFLAMPRLARALPPSVVPLPAPLPLARSLGGSGFAPSQLPYWRKAKAGVLSQTANALVCICGDSTTMGEGSATNSFAPKNVTYWLAEKLQAANPLLYTNQSSIAGDPGQTGATRLTVDPRFSSTGSVTAGPAGFGGPLFSMGASSSLVFTPGTVFDTAIVQMYNGTGTVTVTGGTGVTKTSGTALTLTTATTATASASNAVTISTGAGQTNYVCSIQTFNSAQKSVNVMNCGFYGAQVGNICGTNLSTTAGFAPIAAISQLAPALTILNVGINDWDAGNSVSSWLSTIQGFVAAVQVFGDIILAIGIPNANQLTLQAQYYAALQAYAQSINVPFIDFQARWQSFAYSNGIGLYADSLHPTPSFGMPDIAQAYADVLLAA